MSFLTYPSESAAVRSLGVRSGHRGPLCQSPLYLDPSQKSTSLNRDPTSQPNDCQVGVEDQGRGLQDPPCPSSNLLPSNLGIAALYELGLASLKPGHLPHQPGPASPLVSLTNPSLWAFHRGEKDS